MMNAISSVTYINIIIYYDFYSGRKFFKLVTQNLDQRTDFNQAKILTLQTNLKLLLTNLLFFSHLKHTFKAGLRG